MATIVTQLETPFWTGERLVVLKLHTHGAFEQLALVAGVQGGCFCDNHGAILGMLLAGTGDRQLYERIALALTQCLAVLHTRSAIKEIELRVERKLLVARDLGNALLILVCSPDVNLSLLRMTLNVATSPIESEPKLQQSLAQAAPSRAYTLDQEHLDASVRSLLRKTGQSPS